MPRHTTPFLRSCYAGLERETWLPITGSAPSTTRFGGQAALLRDGEGWPMHDHMDGQPMSLVFQADTDSLPEAMRETFGGAGMVFQLFIPMGNDQNGYPRSWTIDRDDQSIAFFYDVRILRKSDHLIECTCPPAEGIDIPAVAPRFIGSWDRRVDFPFDHGGPYEEGLEEAHQRFDDAAGDLIDDLEYDEAKARIFHADDLDAEKDIEELTNEWGTKIGGWPSLEQGPQGVDERLPHILQICGDDEIGDEVSFDGHGWLCRGPEGQWIWYTVTS